MLLRESSSLVQAFGEPLRHAGDLQKTDATWLVLFGDGVVADIYNYKNGHNYLGTTHGLRVEAITEWSVGSRDRDGCVVDRINAILASSHR